MEAAVRTLTLSLAAALALVLPGCLTAPGDDVDSASLAPSLPADLAAVPTIVADENLTVDAPEWRMGDAWAIEIVGDDAERATLVVVSASGSAYEMASTSATQATFDALFDMSYIGKVRASDLAGHQQDQPVQFFSFPLTDGKRWSTTWDGETIDLHAGFAESIPTPQGPQPGFRIQGTRGDGQTYVEYDYVPALRWWSHILFGQGYGLKVTGTTTNWTGNVQAATAKTLLTLGPAGPVGSTPAGLFTVEAGQTSVAIMIRGAATGPSARALALFDPDGTQHGDTRVTHSADGMREFDTQIVPAKAGEWRLVAPSLHGPGGGFHVTASQVLLAPRAV